MSKTQPNVQSHSMNIAIVIPALNEAGNIADLVREVQAQAICLEDRQPISVTTIIVVDNGSTDETGAQASAAGATVVSEPRRGYGSACAAGTALALQRGAEIIVYLDGDYSALPSELPRLVAPLLRNQADLVLGSRTLGGIAAGAMPPHQRFGNNLFAWLTGLLYGVYLTDSGPYRAIGADLFRTLNMQEMTYGWPTEMTVKAAKRRARILEVPISWHNRRAGVSKVGGTLRGSLLAAQRILTLTFRHAFFV